MYRPDEDRIYYEELRNGRTRETIVRPNGVRIVTVRNRWGDVLKRSRFSPDGREFILAYYDEEEDDRDDRESFFIDPGEDLPPLRLNIPARDYILDVEYADEEEVELFFRQPPVEQVRRIYSVEEVKRSARLRDSVRRIEVGGLTFDSGKATISSSQVGALSKVARADLFCGFGECATGCLADLNRDQQLTFFDVSAFLFSFNSQHPAADLAAPIGSFDFFDLSAFLTAYNAGCP